MDSTRSTMHSAKRKARLIAFYLPQYHPVPENNTWWGPGFTEWTNTAKAKPLFSGHVQPHLPRDLGFYDLRVPETRAHQAELARAHGIEAFCYYHYWFGDKRILERPFDEVLRSGEPDFPFCLCWANESWSGIWHGLPKQVLMEQKYLGVAETEAHFETLLPAFRDPRHLRVDGKPLFLIYKPLGIPDVAATMALWRRLAVKAGLSGLYLVGCADQGAFDTRACGFDAAFAANMPGVRPWFPWTDPVNKLRFKLQQWRGQPTILDYEKVVAGIFPDSLPVDQFPVVIPNWDNTPRSGARGRVLQGATPQKFRQHLARALALVENRSDEQRIVFVKSWNEWAEGNYLEPDMEFGTQWLEAVDAETRL